MRNNREILIMLKILYERNFNGKSKGKYKIPKILFKKICQRKHLKEKFIEKLNQLAFEYGFVLIYHNDFIFVLKKDDLLNYREVPDFIVRLYKKNQEDEKDDDYYWNMVDPKSGKRYTIPFLKETDPAYRVKYIDYMKLKERDPATFEKILNWD